MRPDFIFMLTRADRTVSNARELLPQLVSAGVTRIGFKDVGLPVSELRILSQELREIGAELYMEVVSLDADSEMRSADIAAELGVDWLLGGTRPKLVLPLIANTPIRYCPFAGSITGHPSVLEGPIDEIVDNARETAALNGVHGLDLLAWRFSGDVETLITSVCAAVSKPVIVAGSIDRADRIHTLAKAGARAFTVGTAALDGVFPANSKNLSDQIDFIQQTIRNIGVPLVA